MEGLEVESIEQLLIQSQSTGTIAYAGDLQNFIGISAGESVAPAGNILVFNGQLGAAIPPDLAILTVRIDTTETGRGCNSDAVILDFDYE